MTVETGFVRDLQDHPHDETVRLIFCDWLADQGDPEHLARRRLLQIQSELDAWVPDLTQRKELQQAERELLDQYATSWVGTLPSFTQQFQFRSGLVDIQLEANVLESRRFTAAAESLFDTAWIGKVRILGPRNSPLSFVASPVLARIRQLDLSSCRLSDESLEEMLREVSLQELVTLDLSGNDLTDRGANLLARAELPRLRTLDVRNNRISAVGVRHLLGSSRLADLRQVEVHGNPLSVEAQMEAHTFMEARGGIARRAGLPTRILNSVGMEFALIPAGTFLMGSPETEPERGSCEGPQHEVESTQPFYLSRFPVTQRQYLEVVGNNPAHFTNEPRGLGHPVEMVTWGNAGRFCEQLAQRQPEQGRTYTLPTEAQWEHACRAGTTTPYFFGFSASSSQANFHGRHPYGGGSRGPYVGRTTCVGMYPPNPFGLYDLHGNVWEWCADYYDERFYARSGRRDPTGPRSGTRVSARGGSWSSHASLCRSASRDYWYGPHYCRDNIGFRVALTVPEPSSR